MAARTPEDRSTIAQIGAHESWATTADRAARTKPARAAMDKKFLDEAGGDPVRAEHLRKAYYLRLNRRSVQARRRIAEAAADAEAAEAELAELDALGGETVV